MTKKFNVNLWKKVLNLENQLHKREKGISRSIIQEAFSLSQSLSQHVIWALENKDIIRFRPDTWDTTNSKTIIINDIHIPFQDDIAVEAALSFAEKDKVDTIIINGDLIDFYKISRFSKDPTRKSTVTEIKETKQFLTDLRKRFPKAQIIYKEGNHDLRLKTYLMGNAGEVYELLDNLYEKSLDLEGLNIEYIIDPFKMGHLWIMHGHEKVGGGSGGEHICDNIFKVVLDHFVTAHFHRCQDKTFATIDPNRVYNTFSVGYLAGPMEYAVVNKWNQGLLRLDFNSSGDFRGQPHRILNGEVY